MAYVGFDLDETLGRFTVVYWHVMFLTPLKSYYESEGMRVFDGKTVVYIRPPECSEDLKERMDIALNLFVKKIAEQEKAGSLGFLRPSIIPIAKRLWDLQQKGKVKGVVIYSNNGNLGLLHFAAQLIETIAETPCLFCDFIHWYHPLRRYQEVEVDEEHPGSGKKTMRTLYNIFKIGPCKKKGAPESFEDFKNNLYFFDDANHLNISGTIGKRYFQNPKYIYDVPNDKFINDAFEQSLTESGLYNKETKLYNAEYKAYVEPLGFATFEKTMSFITKEQKNIFKRDDREPNSYFTSQFFSTFPEDGPTPTITPAPAPAPVTESVTTPTPTFPPTVSVSAPAPKGWRRYVPWFK